MARIAPDTMSDDLQLTDFTGMAHRIPDRSIAVASVLVLMRGLW
jgi:hypothetical protein